MWKTCKGWKDNIMLDFRQKVSEDRRSMEISRSDLLDDFHTSDVEYFNTLAIIIIIIIIIIIKKLRFISYSDEMNFILR